MKLFFDPDGPVVQALHILADLLLINVCFLLCCVPLVTIGASISAMYGCYLRRREDEGVVKLFFSCFRKSFRQATVVWIILAAAGILVLADFRLLNVLENTPAIIPFLLALLGMLLLAVGCYVFPMFAVYQDSIPRMLKNALILSITALPKTALMLALNLLPALTLAADVELFGSLLMIWLLIGASAIAKINSFLLKGIFQDKINIDKPDQ